MESGTQHRPFGNLGHKVLPLQALMGDIEIIVTASKVYKCVSLIMTFSMVFYSLKSRLKINIFKSF